LVVKKSEKTRKLILDAGLKMWPDVSARGIARQIGMTHAAIAYYFTQNLKDAIAEHAVKTGKTRIIAQLIAAKHKAVRNLTAEERAKHLNSLN